ncbi:MAG: tRNA epoxyqueuosine(34) reductase QueG [Gemmatimonadaceae bacterium]
MTHALIQSLSLEEMVKAQAYGLGFDLVGITTLGPMETSATFDDWIANGYAGDMGYLERGSEKRRDTRLPLPGARSAIVVALDYGGREPGGPVARYARGDDYHEIMTSRLRELHRWIEFELGHTVAGRAYVDTAPILERELARRAGLGWFGKNTNIVNPRLGSFFFIGSLFIALDLSPDAPFEANRCGSCTKCLDACPTDAFVEPLVLDATRCISYLTIEQKGAIPDELRARVGERLYGCDICQEVCPWNVRFARDLKEERFAPRALLAGKDARALALEILEMDEFSYRESFRKSPMKRAKLAGLARNARAVLQNIDSAGTTASS